MSRQKIILDCDPGIDDALAILLALGAPESIDLLGITTVVGNVGLAQTSDNARRVLALAGREDIPVFAGCGRALMGPVERGAEVHGADGLGGTPLPAPTRPADRKHGVDFIVETVMGSEPGSVTLCPTGPMTNVALAFVKEPAVATRLRALVFMGGAAFTSGNMGEAGNAEFNFFTDPHAAEIVLTSGASRIVMMGLDVTRKAVASPPRIAKLAAAGTRSARAAAAMLQAYGRGEKYLHDPTVIAYLIEPDLFEGSEGSLSVDCLPGAQYGKSVAGPREDSGGRPTVTIMTSIDAEGYFDLLATHLARLA